jgi:hypothetical protein
MHSLNGTFVAPDFGELGVTPKTIVWDQALLLLPIGITILRALRKTRTA